MNTTPPVPQKNAALSTNKKKRLQTEEVLQMERRPVPLRSGLVGVVVRPVSLADCWLGSVAVLLPRFARAQQGRAHQ